MKVKKERELKEFISELSLNEGKKMIFILCGKFAIKNGKMKNFHLGCVRDITAESVQQAREKAVTYLEFKLSKALKDGWYELNGKRIEIDTERKVQCTFNKPPKSLTATLQKQVLDGGL